MTDRPILFSGGMVRAILDGRKSQTRRILKDAPHGSGKTTIKVRPYACPDGRWNWVVDETGMGLRDPFRLPYAPGDLLWVRETINYDWSEGQWKFAADRAVSRQLETPTPHRWPRGCCPSIFMPRRLSRLTLLVTDVRVQRVQDISEADAVAEGWPGTASIETPKPPLVWFWHLWDSIHGPGAWERNDWVAALTFDVIRKNIDEIMKWKPHTRGGHPVRFLHEMPEACTSGQSIVGQVWDDEPPPEWLIVHWNPDGRQISSGATTDYDLIPEDEA